MATLIAVYDGDGCIGRCNALCYDAKEPECSCICGGKNHGAGQSQAFENTRELAERWIERCKAEHPDAEAEVNPAVAQLDLFRGGGTPEIETPTVRAVGAKTKMKKERDHSSPLSSHRQHHRSQTALAAACAVLSQDENTGSAP